jgi:hypothetical protein
MSDLGVTLPPRPEQAARAFANIQFLLEPLLSQYVGMTAVPWQAALDAVCRRLEPGVVDWWLCGSAALAVRGVAVIPRYGPTAANSLEAVKDVIHNDSGG